MIDTKSLGVLARRGAAAVRRHFRSGSSRIRLRRRLYLFAAPVALVALLAALKMIAVVVVGNSAGAAFHRHDIERLRNDVSLLKVFNVFEPQHASFAEGDLRALEGKLGEADERFVDALSRTAGSRSCPVRVNLELVRETRGDLAARDADIDAAEQQYLSALDIVDRAPDGCFQGNTDPSEERRKVREEAAKRLIEKIKALHRPPAPSPPAAPPPSSPEQGGGGSEGGSSSPEQGGGSDSGPPSRSPRPKPDAPTEPGGGSQSGGQGGQSAGGGESGSQGEDGGKPGDLGGGGRPSPFNDIDPDRLPATNDEPQRPNHRFNPDRGDPLDRLRDLLRNSDSWGTNSE